MSYKLMQDAIQRTAKEWTGRLDIPSNYTGQLMDFASGVAEKYAASQVEDVVNKWVDYSDGMGWLDWRTSRSDDGSIVIDIEGEYPKDEDDFSSVPAAKCSATLSSVDEFLECIGHKPAPTEAKS